MQCASGYLLVTVNSSSSCQNKCPNGYYIDPTTSTICVICSIANCIDCSATNCFTCAPTYFLVTTASSVTCQNNCPVGTFSDSITNTCYNCSQNCASCSSGINCNQCAPNYSLYLGYCLSECLSGFVSVNQRC
jgi:hypothetical protein